MAPTNIDRALRTLRRGAVALVFGAGLAGCAVGSDVDPSEGEGETPSGMPGSATLDPVDPGATEGSREPSTWSASGSGGGAGPGEAVDDAAPSAWAAPEGGAGGLDIHDAWDDDGTGVADDGVDDTAAVPPPSEPVLEGAEPADLGAGLDIVCSPIGPGTNSLTVSGQGRVFSAQLPADTSRMALLFLWHGWMQAPDEFANTIVYDVASGRWVPFDPNAFPMPLMIVTPHDRKLIPPAGLDWDIVSGAQDFPFFEGMLRCIQEQFEIDPDRIYSMGFSAGAVFTNLLSAEYPDLFAATISESGAWFNDVAQHSDVLVPLMQWQWPAFDPADGGNVLLTHGGPDDFATVISLESANTKARPFLHASGRTVTDCAHGFGHTLAPDLTQGMIYEYMWAHWRGGPATPGLIPSFPTPERPIGSTSCTFRPAP